MGTMESPTRTPCLMDVFKPFDLNWRLQSALAAVKHVVRAPMAMPVCSSDSEPTEALQQMRTGPVPTAAVDAAMLQMWAKTSYECRDWPSAKSDLKIARSTRCLLVEVLSHLDDASAELTCAVNCSVALTGTRAVQSMLGRQCAVCTVHGPHGHGRQAQAQKILAQPSAATNRPGLGAQPLQ